MRNYRSTAARSILAALLSTAVSVRAAVIDFNHYTSPTDNDLVNNFEVYGATDQFRQVSGNGITGGAVANGGNGGGATYRAPQTRPTTLSVSFLYDGPMTVGGGVSARLGWVGGVSSVDPFSPSNYFSGEFHNDGGFGLYNNPSGQVLGGATVQLGFIGAPTLGHWLQLSFRAVPLDGPNYELGLALQDLGISGQESPSLLFSGSTQVTNALAAADESMFPGFRGWYRAAYYDNFSVAPIPEPGSLLLVGVGATVLGASSRNRRTSSKAAGVGSGSAGLKLEQAVGVNRQSAGRSTG